MLTGCLEKNISIIVDMFGDDPTLIVRRFRTRPPQKLRCAVIFFDGMTDGEYISRNIIGRVMTAEILTAASAQTTLLEHFIAAGEAKRCEKQDEQCFALSSGDCLLFCEGENSAVVFSTKGYLKRTPEEPENEMTAHGAREGFIEPLMHNLALLRRRLKSPSLRLEYVDFGVESRQKGCIVYLDGVADAAVLQEFRRRLKAVEQTEGLDMNCIVERIKDHPLSPLRMTGLTERPDTAASKLLEGRVGLFLDGSPVFLSVPFVFTEYFQSPDDYFQNYLLASFSRMLRILCFFLSIGVPALYVSLLTFHPEIIPTKLLLSIASARAGVPFPLLLETLLLLLAFEVLRDASLRMSPTLGQSLSIVGALILGEASVSARLVSAPLVIVAALTAMAGLINPQLKPVSVLLRFALLIIAGFAGIYGLIFGLCIFALALSCLRCFGVRYTDFILPDRKGAASDSIWRAPWSRMRSGRLFGRGDNRGA